MWLSRFKVGLKHSKDEVSEQLGVSYNDLNLDDLCPLLEKSTRAFVSIPKDFSKTGTKGISLHEKGISLYETIGRQIKGIRNTLAMAVLMAIFWVSEALPIPVVALLPMVFLPVLGIAHFKTLSMPGYFPAFSPYMDHLIVLFIGGFTIAEAMKKWGLHERIALHFIKVIGFSPKMIVLSLMVATGFISMFVSNTATTAMMIPIGLAIILSSGEKPRESHFDGVMMLGIAYAASIGGVGTLIGTPPNLVLAGFVDTLLLQDHHF